jgi:hypothetical protein
MGTITWRTLWHIFADSGAPKIAICGKSTARRIPPIEALMKSNSQDDWADVLEYKVRNVMWVGISRRPDNVIYVAEREGKALNIRLNNFPDEPLFTLIVDGREAIHFNEWPQEWGKRPELREAM